MTINSVNFRGAENSPFADIVAKPQSYQEKAAASTGVKGDEFKKSHKGAKTLGVIALAAAAVAAALGFGAKKGVFTNEKITNETLKTVGKHLDTAGKFITEKAGTLWESVKGLLSKGKEKVAEEAGKAGEVASELAETV